MAKQFKNITPGPKGFYDEAGNLHMIEPGALTPEGVKFAKDEPQKAWFGSPEAGDAERQAELGASLAAGAAVGDQLDQLRASFDQEKADLLGRAENAERTVDQLRAENDQLKQQLSALDRDGNGKAGGSEAQDPPALTGKTKAQLLEIADTETVTEAKDADGKSIPIGEATNAQIVEAIEAKRAA